MRRILFSRSGFLPLLLFICACSNGGAGDPTHGFRVFSEDGVTIAENEGAPKFTGDIFTYERVLELRADPDVEGSMLLDPYQITRDSDGNIYVEDEGDMSIVMFDSAGRFLRRFGREGHGPGEFRGMARPRISGDILYTYDWSQKRITRFRRSGELIDVLPLPVDQGPGLFFARIEALIMDREERRIIIRQIMGRGDTEGRMGFEALVLDAGNDTLWSVSTPMQKSSYVTRRGNSMVISLIPYGIVPSIACHPDYGIYFSDGENPVVHRYTMEGNRGSRWQSVQGDQS